ncbi:hypothetical protein TRAPUB_8745 [Trametes pubescens]|uniref:Uncharacterized protein n=1 Tax=Trametes pubescens TaxID=154538 RepID=A0A1M2W4K7_TRAPU|nr:hypothetical protein TRAPUB_8745 [Trametes pubescens]
MLYRYAITDAAADWSAAEAQVAKIATEGGASKSTLVSVKAAAGAKRKAEDGAQADGKGAGADKKARRSMSKKSKR